MAMRFGHGGRRDGAGRKPVLVEGRQCVGHGIRPYVDASNGLSVTLRLMPGLPSLRRQNAYRVILNAIRARKGRPGFRIIEFSVMSNHIHMLCEGDDRTLVSRAMQGLCSSIARLLNRLWARTGKLFADRFHIDVLKVPRRAFNALRYILKNAWKHRLRMRGALVDHFSSAPWFAGYRHESPNTSTTLQAEQRRLRNEFGPDPCSHPESWLLESGWTKDRELRVHDTPSA